MGEHPVTMLMLRHGVHSIDVGRFPPRVESRITIVRSHASGGGNDDDEKMVGMANERE